MCRTHAPQHRACSQIAFKGVFRGKFTPKATTVYYPADDDSFHNDDYKTQQQISDQAPFSQCNLVANQNELECHEDPSQSAASRSTVCAVCQVDTGSYNLNYGANSCLSCRAFFRRAIQKTRNPNFACRYDGNCEISGDTRRCCKKCRFDKCIKAGMRADCVMDGSAIQARFSKYIQRRKGIDKKAATMAKRAEEAGLKYTGMNTFSLETLGSPQSTRELGIIRKRTKRSKKIRDVEKDLLKMAVKEFPEAEEDNKEGLTESYEQKVSVVQNDFVTGDFLPFQQDFMGNNFLSEDDLYSTPPSAVSSSWSDGNSVSPQRSEISSFSSPTRSETTITPDSGIGEHDFPIFFDLDLLPSLTGGVETDNKQNITLLDKDQMTWFRVLEEENLVGRFGDEVLNSLSLGGNRMKQSLTIALRASYESIFNRLSAIQPEFMQLSSEERSLLLKRNATLFVNYIIGRVISSTNVWEQLHWLLLSSNPAPMNSLNLLRIITAEDLLVFTDVASANDYIANASILASMNLKLEDGWQVALACLYRTDTLSSSVENTEDIQMLQNAYNRLGVEKNETLQKTVSALLKMTAAIDQNFQLMKECELILSLPEVANLFDGVSSGENDEWLAEKFVAFDRALSEISFGADFVKECVMYSLGVPLSKHFLPQGTKKWLARFHRILLNHSEFASLPLEEQNELWAQGTFTALAMTKAKLESCKTGNEQFKLAFGREDQNTMAEVFSIHRRMPRMKRILTKEWSRPFHVLDESVIDRMTELFDKLAPLMQTEESYKLMTLLAMFASIGQCNPELSGVTHRYMATLKSRTPGVLESRESELEFENRIKQALCDCKELATILQKLSDAVMEEIKKNNGA